MSDFIPDKKFQSIITAIENGQNVILYGPGGTGKCLDPDQGVLMYDGSVVRAKDVQMDDLLMGDDSTPRRVLSTCTGEDEMFRLETSKGDVLNVNSAHMLSLKCSYNNKIKWESSTERYRVMWNENGVRKSKIFSILTCGTKEVAESKANEFLTTLTSGKGEVIDISVVDYMDKSNTWKDQYRLFKVGVDFPDNNEELLIDPYFLGIWLGDGTSIYPNITTIEPEIVGWLTTYAKQLGQSLKQGKGRHNITYRITGPTSKCKMRVRLRMLNLLGNKHIPDRYLKGSKETRMKVLAGLIDSDGYLDNNTYEIVQKNSGLMRDIVFLARSLGFACYSHPCEKTCTNSPSGPKTGTYNKGRVYGEGLEQIPLLLQRKKASPRKQIKDALVLGFEITPLGEGKYCGFTLDGNHRFLLDNFIVTHNTFLLREIATYLQEKGKVVGVTATTGVAALNLNIPERKIQGRTLHSWGGVGLGDEVVAKLVAKIKPAPKKRWFETDILIIDEVSMLGGDFFDKLDFIGRIIRQREMDPMGGIQLILSGDFLQLPPVKDEFCFQSLAWNELALTPFIFSEPKRYDDPDYFQLLLRVRDGEPTNEDIKCLYARVQAYEHFCKMVEDCADETKIIKPTKAYSHRSKVEYTNDKELEKLPGTTYDFNCIDSLKQYTKNFKKDYYLRQLEDAAPQQVSLKVGAQVMLKCNMSIEMGLVNGSRGVITEIDFESEIITVKFLRGRTARIERHEWEFEDKEGKGIRSQIPLILAWACTIHKLQGCTLDFCVLDLGHTIFACGQAYVGLSRVRSLKGLFLSSFESSSIMTSKTALQYSRELQLKEKLMDEDGGSTRESVGSDRETDNDSEVELSDIDSENTTEDEEWDEEEFVAQLILDYDLIKKYEENDSDIFIHDILYGDILPQEVKKLWKWLPFEDDCLYHTKVKGCYEFIPTGTKACDRCYRHNKCNIIGETSDGFEHNIMSKIVSRIEQLPVKTEIVFHE